MSKPVLSVHLLCIATCRWGVGGFPGGRCSVPGLKRSGWCLFTQLWGSPGPREIEDVFRASLIMSTSEEINRPGPAGMLQLLPSLVGVKGQTRGEVDSVEWKEEVARRGGWEARRREDGRPGQETVALHTRGYTITLALWFHICMALRACKSLVVVWQEANTVFLPTPLVFSNNYSRYVPVCVKHISAFATKH